MTSLAARQAATACGEHLLSQGAEARIYKHVYCDVPCVVKERFPKRYRHPVLDESLTQSRVKAEARHMVKASKAGISTPILYYVDTYTARIYMQYVEGPTLNAYLQQEVDATDLGFALGVLLGQLHNANIIHGDITTSNILVVEDKLVLLDFGLSSTSALHEDKAVDLYVLERALASTHPQHELMPSVLGGYQQENRASNAVIARFNQVRLRGRKRDMTG